MTQTEKTQADTNPPVTLQDAQLDDAQGGVTLIAQPGSQPKPPVSKDYTHAGGTCE
jgi:hypothetical protein